MNDQNNGFRPDYTPGAYNYTMPQTPPAAPGNKHSGLATASLVFGILSVCCCCCCGPIFGIPAVILAIVEGAQNKSDCGSFKLSGSSIAGLICGIISIIFTVVLCIIYGFSFSALTAADYEEFMDMFKEFQNSGTFPSY